MVPLANVFMDPNLKSPLTHEVTVSYGETFRRGKGYAEVAYINRQTGSLIETFSTLAAHTKAGVVLASSSATLLPSHIAGRNPAADRIVVGHPT